MESPVATELPYIQLRIPRPTFFVPKFKRKPRLWRPLDPPKDYLEEDGKEPRVLQDPAEILRENVCPRFSSKLRPHEDDIKPTSKNKIL